MQSLFTSSAETVKYGACTSTGVGDFLLLFCFSLWSYKSAFQLNSTFVLVTSVLKKNDMPSFLFTVHSLSLFFSGIESLVLFFGVHTIWIFYTSVSYMKSFLVDCIISVKVK